MGAIHLKTIGKFQEHENTASEYDNQIESNLIRFRLDQIASAVKSQEGLSCFVFGMGAQPKSVYTKLKKYKGVELLWTGTILSGVLKLLGQFIPSHAGLLEVFDLDALPEIFLELSDQSMAGIYVLKKSQKEKFIREVMKNPLPAYYDFGIKEDDRYFFYILDADNSESSTGVYEFISIGKGADYLPQTL